VIQNECYWAERGVGDYPQPERNNPKKEIEKEYAIKR
jgi:hypothetical protein